MSRLRALNSRLKLLYLEIAKFGLVGVAGIVVNLLVFNLLIGTTQLQTVRSGVIATAVAIVFNYVGLRFFTYRDADTGDGGKEIGLFVFFSVIGAIIENGVLYLATYGFGLHGALASNVFKFTGIGLATLFRFWSYRTWVFRSLDGVAAQQAEAIVADAEAESRMRSGGGSPRR